MFIKKNTYTYIDHLGQKHKLKISPEDIVCVPYEIIEMGTKTLRDKGLCKLTYWETYQGSNLQSMSIICKKADDLIGKQFTQEEIRKMAISNEALKDFISEKEEPER